MMGNHLLQFGTVVSIVTIVISLIGRAQTRKLTKLEILVLSDDRYDDSKSKVISYIEEIDYYEKVLGFTEDEVARDFEHMKQYYHKLMEFYPDSLAKVKEEARKYLKKDYKKTGRETT